MRVLLSLLIILPLSTVSALAKPTLAFEDVSTSAGLVRSDIPVDHLSASWVDVDGDGWVDLFMNSPRSGKAPLRFYWNAHDGRFEPMAITVQQMRFPGVFCDVDNDGDPDFFTPNAGGHLVRNDRTKFTHLPKAVEEHPFATPGSSWADLDNDGWLDFYRSGYESPDGGKHFPDARYRNNGKGTYLERIWWQETPGKWHEKNAGNRRPARGVTSADYDEDGDMDIYVSNYRLAPNSLWRNEGGGEFTDVGKEVGAAGLPDQGAGKFVWGHTIGSAWGDLNNDGHLDLYVGNFSHDWTAGDPPIRYQDPPMALENLGPAHDWKFKMRTHIKTGVAETGWVESAGSPALGDFDNDGDLDIFLAAFSGIYPGDESRLFRNDGNWQFTDISGEVGLNIATKRNNLMSAWGDYDNDGDLDLATAGRLFRNNLESENHWLKIKLRGDGNTVNRDAIGAQVRIKAGALGTLTRQVETTTGYASQNDMTLHFGLGKHTGPVKLEIRWPDGSKTQHETAVDHSIEIHYDQGKD